MADNDVKISVVVPFHNDYEYIGMVVSALCEGQDPAEFEIIIVNDGSKDTGGKFAPLTTGRDSSCLNSSNVYIINNPLSYGVGYSFDRGVEQASGNIIVLMGADVIVRPTWLQDVRNAVERNPNTLGCSVCIGINPSRMDIDDEKNFRRYGAELLFTVDGDDLPESSPLRGRKGGYTSLFKGKWMFGQLGNEPYEIPCLMGAFYWTSKDYYNLIGGWDTRAGHRYRGHRAWGHLEPFISLKSWLVGGGCTLYPDIETAHIFGRVDGGNRHSKGLRGADWRWWNACWMAETMILDPVQRNNLYNFLNPELNLNIARKWIRQNRDNVEQTRERNRLVFKNTPELFTEKFGYIFKY